jgi:ABC-type polysaccharide transport system permease subunit
MPFISYLTRDPPVFPALRLTNPSDNNNASISSKVKSRGFDFKRFNSLSFWLNIFNPLFYACLIMFIVSYIPLFGVIFAWDEFRVTSAVCGLLIADWFGIFIIVM